MGVLKEKEEWVDEVYQLETTDPVVGGEDGIDNKAPRQLAWRTRWLKARLDSLRTSSTKRRIIHNLDITFADYTKALNTLKVNDAWMYPQAFTITNNIIYVVYYLQTTFRATVACFDFDTGNYLGYYTLKTNQDETGIGEGIVVKNGKIFIGFGEYIVGFKIGKYGDMLAENERHPVNLQWQFNYANGEWVVEQKVEQVSGMRTRTQYGVFDDSFNLKHYFNAATPSASYTNEDTLLAKRQSTFARGSYVLSGFGAYYDANKTLAPMRYQGAKLTSGGDCIAQAFYNPKLLMDKFNKLGYTATRMENEGAFITDDNRCLTLFCIDGSGTAKGGMLIIEEFSQHVDAIDFIDCSVISQDSRTDRLLPFAYKNNELVNPKNGELLTNLTDVCLLMKDFDQQTASIYIRSDNGLILFDDEVIPKYSFVHILNGNGNTYKIKVENTNKIVSHFLFYPTETEAANKIRRIPENWSGNDIWWTKPFKATSVYHRAYSQSYDGNWYNWLDMQHAGSTHKMLLGGSSGSYYAFDELDFCTSKGDGQKGYYVHWKLGTDGYLVPNGNKAVGIGTADKMLKELHIQTVNEDNSGSNAANTYWVRRHTINSIKRGGTKNGWCMLPNGLIFQWGEAVFTGKSSGTVNFPLAFNTCYQVIVSDVVATGGVVPIAARDITSAGFTVLGTDSVGVISYFAIGV